MHFLGSNRACVLITGCGCSQGSYQFAALTKGERATREGLSGCTSALGQRLFAQSKEAESSPLSRHY